MKIWIEGRVVEAGEAKLSVTDHGLLYGDGVFEGMRVFGGAVFRLDDHLARLSTGAKALAIEIPGGLSRVREIVLETVRAHAEPEAYVRLVLTRGEGALGVDPTTCEEPNLFCIVSDVHIYPEEMLSRGIALVTSSLRRPGPDVLDPRIKSLNYLNNVLAKAEARRQGADEALLLGGAGLVAEAAVANVFAVVRGELRTPPVSDGALEGITRRTLLELAGTLGMPAAERSLTRFDLLGADEVFLSGSGAGVVPVRSLDGATIGSGRPGEVWSKLRRAYLETTASLGVAAL